MKTFTIRIILTAFTFITTLNFVSCKKQEQEPNKPIENAIGRWANNRVQLKIYYGGVFYKDSIMPFKAGNNFFTQLDADRKFQYSFNSRTIDVGTYVFKGQDSIIGTTPAKIYRWKLLTLTDVLFTTKNVSNNDPAFPGATVETYYTFTRR
jgi:hypothetical protein